MTDHIWEEHENCDRLGCCVCEGGLAICTVCGLIEGSLTTDCPGVRSHALYGDDIYAGKIDFKSGKWVCACSPYSPAGHVISKDDIVVNLSTALKVDASVDKEIDKYFAKSIPKSRKLGSVNEIIVKAEFYNSVSCLFAEGVEFMTKEQIYQTIKEDFYKAQKALR